MLLRLIEWFASFLHERHIDRSDGSDYLRRYTIHGFDERDFKQGKKFRFNAYLHNILTEDEDAALHNHPWTWGLSIVLNGGYSEVRSGGYGAPKYRKLRRLSINFIRHGDFHRIDLVRPNTWTLFITGKKVSTWGFAPFRKGRFGGIWYDIDNVVPWRERLRSRGIEPKY